ncbi:hypothetical protein B0T26DRAFT_756640 [Lasiosphaeria miniovina]|uniref:Uncharacterized protein n=1 Tax=Lasiosphaeria miniovina TaxID=1954250 RepID=A0AA39ZSZ4_9PEZI|nr:uncharacterized protein B0T26DRAFT_756640 [Lasiosphaeria miniovina]KAK0703062.1 hypothetical protein B0T26DRAFT_756640 [Lasiosphaeria miniovina]
MTTAEESLAAFRDKKQRYFESTELGRSRPDQSSRTPSGTCGSRNKIPVDWRGPGKSGSFTDYGRAARRRLAEHGFHEAFRLLKDPRRQDERATSIEYLGFEYWWLDADAKTVQRHKPSHDAAWEELVQFGVLEASAEDLFTHLAGEPDQQTTPRDEAIQHFMRQTRAYRDATVVESSQSLRIQWALSQIPAATKPIARTGKRRLQEDEDALDEAVEQRPAAKKQRTEPERKQDGGVSAGKGNGCTEAEHESGVGALDADKPLMGAQGGETQHLYKACQRTG